VLAELALFVEDALAHSGGQRGDRRTHRRHCRELDLTLPLTEGP
jgi:hypothetical protein